MDMTCPYLPPRKTLKMQLPSSARTFSGDSTALARCHSLPYVSEIACDLMSASLIQSSLILTLSFDLRITSKSELQSGASRIQESWSSKSSNSFFEVIFSTRRRSPPSIMTGKRITIIGKGLIMSYSINIYHTYTCHIRCPRSHLCGTR